MKKTFVDLINDWASFEKEYVYFSKPRIPIRKINNPIISSEDSLFLFLSLEYFVFTIGKTMNENNFPHKLFMTLMKTMQFRNPQPIFERIWHRLIGSSDLKEYSHTVSNNKKTCTRKYLWPIM